MARTSRDVRARASPRARRAPARAWRAWPRLRGPAGSAVPLQRNRDAERDHVRESRAALAGTSASSAPVGLLARLRKSRFGGGDLFLLREHGDLRVVREWCASSALGVQADRVDRRLGRERRVARRRRSSARAFVFAVRDAASRSRSPDLPAPPGCCARRARRPGCRARRDRRLRRRRFRAVTWSACSAIDRGHRLGVVAIEPGERGVALDRGDAQRSSRHADFSASRSKRCRAQLALFAAREFLHDADARAWS